jgi:REP element-mobilizing transposase RayT
MGNHYHFILETSVARLSPGMHRLNGLYAQEFNERYARDGHLFGDRFGAEAIQDERHLENACRYTILNPVRAGLCARPVDWPWSWSRYGLDL